ncbi:MAG TPA: prepilin-type N-terminal cleavage/methylation domain-containing protein [Myxococcota bacterium]
MQLRGFTLVEAMMTVAVVGVLAALATASLSDIVGAARLRSDADAIDDTLRVARNLARLERRCVQVVATAERLTTTPLDHGLVPPPPDCSGGRLIGERKVQLDLPRGLRLSPVSFIFDRSGGLLIGDAPARDGGGVDIVVFVSEPRTGARTFRVTVLAGSGAISRRS